MPRVPVGPRAPATEFVCNDERFFVIRDAGGRVRRHELRRYVLSLQLTELMLAAGRPPLAYSLPAFHPDAWAQAPHWLELLRQYGFRWVTLHPTYIVRDGLRIRAVRDVT